MAMIVLTLEDIIGLSILSVFLLLFIIYLALKALRAITNKLSLVQKKHFKHKRMVDISNNTEDSKDGQ